MFCSSSFSGTTTDTSGNSNTRVNQAGGSLAYVLTGIRVTASCHRQHDALQIHQRRNRTPVELEVRAARVPSRWRCHETPRFVVDVAPARRLPAPITPRRVLFTAFV